MRFLIFIVITLCIFVTGAALGQLVFLVLAPVAAEASSPPFILSYLVGGLTGFAGAWFMWQRLRKPKSDALGAAILTGACILGSLAFTAGFLGPMIFAPQYPSGPIILGFLVWGPCGVLGGAIGGAIWWLVQRKHKTNQTSS